MNTSPLQVFILPFAGGNCYSFRFLNAYFGDKTEVYVLELPGRGRRIREAQINSSEVAINDYLNQLLQLRKKELEFVIYGHSMGAILGLALVHQLELLNDKPLRFIASGSAGPEISIRKDKDRCNMNDEELKKELIKLGGVPHELLENQDLFNFFNRQIRADFEVLKNDISWSNVRLKTPAHFIMGSEEEQINLLNNWLNYLSNPMKYSLLKGGHFFIYDHPKSIASIIENGIS